MVLKSILPHRRPRTGKVAGVRFDRPGGTCLQLKCCHCAPVAQMDRAFASGAKGRWFESTRAYQQPKSNHTFACVEFRPLAKSVYSLGAIEKRFFNSRPDSSPIRPLRAQIARM